MTENIDPEAIFKEFDKIDASLAKLRKLISPIVFIEELTRPVPRAREPAHPGQRGDFPVLDIDVSQIEFYQKDRTIAGPYASWGWTHAYDYGEYKEESRQLVQAIEQYGRVQVGEREYYFSGRDGKLLSFKKVKSD